LTSGVLPIASMMPLRVVTWGLQVFSGVEAT
jgi:hypothetical protein